MPTPSLVLFDDRTAREWEPFASTRPAGELRVGALLLRERAERVLRGRCVLHVAAEHLAGFEEEDAPPVGTPADIPADGDRLFWLSRAIPAWGSAERLAGAAEGPVRIAGEVVGWYAPDGSAAPPAQWFETPGAPADQRGLDLEGHVLGRVWDLLSRNAEQIRLDVEALFPTPPTPSLPDGVYHWGEHPLVVDPSVQLEPGSVIDTSGGPVWLDRDVQVRAFTRLCGPAYVGPGSALLGGSVECCSIGPVSKIRGEFTSSVCLGYSNKQHDGHIGHAYLGRWVNLGAETTNSDLKNNYGTIRLWTPSGEEDTGEIKLGSLLGDHVKTGIGLLLNTGTVVGAGSNLYGAAMPPRFVPPFSWGTGEELVEYRVDKFLEVAERAMERREVVLSESQRAQLQRAWERSARWREPTPAPRG